MQSFVFCFFPVLNLCFGLRAKDIITEDFRPSMRFEAKSNPLKNTIFICIP